MGTHPFLVDLAVITRNLVDDTVRCYTFLIRLYQVVYRSNWDKLPPIFIAAL